MLKSDVHTDRPSYRLCRLVHGIWHAVRMVAIGLFICLASLPALAHDEEKGPAPSAGEVAAAGQVTTAILSLATGFIVFYGFQRRRALNFDKHPPEWDKKMGRNAILFALISAVVVGGVTAALSRPPAGASHAAPEEAPKPAGP